MENGHAGPLQSLRSFRHRVFQFPLVVEQFGHLVVRCVQGLLRCLSLLLQLLGIILGSAIACVVIGSFQVSHGVPRFLDLMGRVRGIFLGGIELDQARRPLLALPCKPLDFFLSPFGLFLLPGV